MSLRPSGRVHLRTTLDSRVLALGLTSAEVDALAPAIEYRQLFYSRPPAPPSLQAWADACGVQLRSLHEIARERGNRSQKILFGLQDGYAIESVLIRRIDGHTACVSSQVGCAFSCRFCASGQAGLMRNLSAGEIVEQVVQLGRRVNRIVFMGIGEPLNNYEQVLKAIRILRDRRGLDFPTTGITISLHATTQETRDQLISGARKHDISEVVARALSWSDRHNRVVTFAYVVLPGVNDMPADAARLVRMLAGRKARVNLMRWNPVEGIDLSRTLDQRLVRFRDTLARGGVPAVVRDTQGRDISAACGQLWLRDLQGVRLGRGPGHAP